MTSICTYLRSKQNGTNRKRNNYSCWNASFLNRLGITHELKGHNGCVNCLEWSKDGSKLISGSDDLTVRIWTPLDHPVNTIPKQPVEKHVRFMTPHRMNIFDLKFMKEESQIISCAADCAICWIDIETESAQQLWKAEGGRMKKLATHDECVFTAACEDGKVYLFDLRSRNRPESEIVDQEALENDINPKCLDYSKRKMTLAVGYTSSVVRVFDLRQTSQTMKKYSPGALVFNNGSSGSYMHYHVTDVRFNDSGDELLVNVGNDHIYLFDMQNDSHTKMTLPDIEPTEEDGNPNVPFSAIAEKFKNEGNAAFREENYWVAEQLYSDALFSSPKNPVLLSNSAAALARRNYRGDHYHCFRLAQRALQTTPSYKKCRLKAIKAMEKMKLWENVKDEYQKLLDSDRELLTTREIAKYKKEISTAQGKISEYQENCANAGRDPEMRKLSVEKYLSENVDYKYRFLGHANAETDIKEAAFLGDEYIAAGSDCGNLFIWHRSGRLIYLAQGDSAIVNCVQPNRFASILATSGIDNEIRIWSPTLSEKVDAFTLETDPTFFNEQCDENQHSLQRPNFFDHNNLAHFSTMIRDDLISRENCQYQ